MTTSSSPPSSTGASCGGSCTALGAAAGRSLLLWTKLTTAQAAENAHSLRAALR